MNLSCGKKEDFLKTENEIYCYVNGFLKWNISKK